MGKGGGGKQHVPVEKPDNLKSTQTLRIIDLISEGEIEGPVNGLQSVYFDDTPVQNSDGSYNFSGLDFDYVTGTPTQPVLTGFDAVENEVPVNAELKHGDPVVRNVTSQDVDAVRVTVGVKGLLQQRDNGDMIYNTVQLAVEVDGQPPELVEIHGKTSSEYLQAVTIRAPKRRRPFSIRVSRQSPDFESAKKQGATFWSSYTEIIDSKLTYPNTALVGIALDSSQFAGVPRRNYLVRGRRIRVPSNYDPESRTYTGIWDGTFKIAWSNNPAWVFYDLATCERAGLGRRLGPNGADKWTLYQIAQYCDQPVDDGQGGKEPRLTCNVAITDAQQAGRVLNDLCSLFRAMPLWNGFELSASVDMPRDPVARYTNANVIDGHFKYASTGLKARKTAVHVKYVSPANGWKETTKYVSDDDAIARYGLHVEQLTAWACTSESQAIRAGRWYLSTNQVETQTVTFKLAREGLQHLPGDVIEVMDNYYAGAQAGGRVVAVDGTHVTLDRAVTIRDGEHGHFGYLDSNADAQSLDVLTQLDDRTLALNGEPDIAPYGVWTLSTASLKPRLFRCLGVAERDGEYEITALQHEPKKYAYIENRIAIETDTDTLYSGTLPPVEHLQVDVSRDASQYQVRLHWQTPRSVEGLTFDVVLLRESRVHSRHNVNDTELSVSGLRAGQYTARVCAKAQSGQKGADTTTHFEITAPTAPTAIQFESTNFSITARPELENANALGTEYEWYFGTSRAQVEQRKHRLGRAFILTHQGRKPDTQYWYGVEAVNAVGRSELVIGSTKTLLKPEDILNLIAPEIPKIDWIKELRESVKNNSSKLVMLSDRAALVVNKDNRISGISVSAESEASAIDFLADFVSFTNPDTLDRDLYWDSNAKTLVMKGQIKLMDGHTVSGIEDIRAQDGEDGQTIYTEFQFSADKRSWHYPERSGDKYMRSRQVTDGNAGSWGQTVRVKGEDGQSATERYTWIKYADSADGRGLSNNPEGKAYIGVAYNKTSATESNNPSDYTWQRVKGEDGNDGQTIYTEFQFSADKRSWHYPERSGDKYMRSRQVTDGNAGSWGQTVRVKGEDGQSATERYTWIKYADSADGRGLSNNPDGKAYIGVAYNKTSATESSNPSDYTWQRVKGEDGQPGKDGKNGSGAGIYRLQTETGVWPSDSVASSLFRSHVGRDPQIDDTFTLYALDADGTVTRADSKMFDGKKWTTPKLFVDGNLIAVGTIRGDRLVAGSVINAPVIKGGEAYFGKGGRYNGYHTHISDDGTINCTRFNLVSESSGGSLTISGDRIVTRDASTGSEVRIGNLE